MSQKSQQKSQLFRIHVRPDLKPTEVEQGFLDREGEPQGTLVKAIIAPTPQTIPNFYNHLVIKELNANGTYNGKFRFVDDYNNEGTVESIEIRYIENCPSLDKKWQDTKDYKPKNAQAYVGWTYPSNEIQEFDLKSSDPLFIDFLKHHQGNGSNVNRDRNNGIMFLEVDAVSSVNKKKENFKKQIEETKLIEKIYDNEDIVNIYASLLGINKNYETDIKRDEVLAKVDDLTVSTFISNISEFKQQEIKFIESWLENKQVKIKNKEFILTGNPPTKLFGSEVFTSESSTDLIKELVELAYTKESVFNELRQLQLDLNKNNN